ncbi:MAG: PP0621 family protein [Polaromonas sp.]|nr:PP0621 family protein [Polaromonas sp.]
MKYLLILLMVVVVLWLWRSKRPDAGAQQPEAPRGKRAVLPPAEMVACDICDVHLPRTEALAGPGGLYCSDAHRRQASER